jgi:Highly conserved protein containing a thioredoxin domain
MEKWIKQAFEKSMEKYAATIKTAAEQGIIPYSGLKDKWQGSPQERNTWWTGGFWPALMWQFYNFSKDETFLKEARRVQDILHHELLYAYEGLHHDVGFMFKLSFGAENQLFPSNELEKTILRCADLLAGRFNPLGFIKAWNGEDKCGWAIVDCMMNLPLLYWASAHSGDPRYKKIADIHAHFTMENFIRPDGSSNHIVISDPETGEILKKPGGQGYAEGSSWSRGQSWALHGFVLAYINTKNPEYLDTAKRIAHYFIANIREDGLVDCDFRQPKTEERLDNIGGACAASGLLLLETLVPELEKPMYRDAAVKMLRAMDEKCADYSMDTYGVLQKCTAAYHDDGAGRHINIVYGDYFYLEALYRLMGGELMLWGLE